MLIKYRTGSISLNQNMLIKYRTGSISLNQNMLIKHRTISLNQNMLIKHRTGMDQSEHVKGRHVKEIRGVSAERETVNSERVDEDRMNEPSLIHYTVHYSNTHTPTEM